MNETPATFWGVIILGLSGVGVFFRSVIAPAVDKLVVAKIAGMESRRKLIDEATATITANSRELREIREDIEKMKETDREILAILEKEE